MLFNSLEFALFLPTVFCLYWFLLRGTGSRNALLLIASYVFYGWWDWRFLGLLVLSTIIDFAAGRLIATSAAAGRRRMFVAISILTNLGILGVFKYFNFFADSLARAFLSVGVELSPVTLNVVLPVGISFYTFQTLSYSIDVYRGRLAASDDFIAFSAYVAFFPQLVAGPIERAVNLLPQFAEPKTFFFAEAREGMRQILWGLFKKVVIADTCGRMVDPIFSGAADLSGTTLLLGAVLFAFQIYGDFSGYSDIAIGTARLFGFKLMQNFAYPYFSRDIAEFWRRWHISLSTWFRDYVYIPLGGSRIGGLRGLTNIFIVFVVSGLWHGANWTFVVWGALNAAYFLPLFLAKAHRRYVDDPAPGRHLPAVGEAARIVSTFLLTCLAWIFFRAASVSDALVYIRNLFVFDAIDPRPQLATLDIVSGEVVVLCAFILLMVTAEWIQRSKRFALEALPLRIPARWALYVVLFMSVLLYWGPGREFIYFQF